MVSKGHVLSTHVHRSGNQSGSYTLSSIPRMDMVQVDTPKTTTNTLSMFIATPVRSCGRENFSNVFLTAHLLAE